jgi:hypothetical protein
VRATCRFKEQLNNPEGLPGIRCVHDILFLRCSRLQMNDKSGRQCGTQIQWTIGFGLIVTGAFFSRAVRGTRRRELACACDINLSKSSAVLPRSLMTVGRDKKVIERLNLFDKTFKFVVLIGDRRSGNTNFLSNNLMNDLSPWCRYVLPPRGFFLNGSFYLPTIEDWLRTEIAVDIGKGDPWSGLVDVLSKIYQEQRLRLFLLKVFKTSLPSTLRPKPVILVVDQAEFLLRSYRADFLVGLSNLTKELGDSIHFRLVLVINTDNAIKALNLLDEGNGFEILQAQNISREIVVGSYGESFAKVFDDCDSSIGMAVDYTNSCDGMAAKDYTVKAKENYSHTCLTVEITREEYVQAKERKYLRK